MASAALATDVLHMTYDEYVAFEEGADVRHEFLDGLVVAMAGGTRNHTEIIGSVYAALRGALRGGPCHPYLGDLRVRVESANRDFYPDAAVVCGEERYETEKRTALVNPTLLVEVLSASTERFDRGKKFAFYRQIPSLREYVLVAQDRASVEVFRKGEGGRWTLFEPDEGGAIELASVGAVLRLADVYENVDFEGETDPDEAGRPPPSAA